MITDHLMLDVLRSTTTTPGELCVLITLSTVSHKSHALCSDLGDFVFVSIMLNIICILTPSCTHFACTALYALYSTTHFSVELMMMTAFHKTPFKVNTFHCFPVLESETTRNTFYGTCICQCVAFRMPKQVVMY